MKATLLVSLVTGSALLSIAGPAIGAGRTLDPGASPTTSPRCADPEYRRLDFWVGDWDAYEAEDRTRAVARARVDVILGGCALHETYEQADGLVGESFTTYDAPRKL